MRRRWHHRPASPRDSLAGRRPGGPVGDGSGAAKIPGVQPGSRGVPRGTALPRVGHRDGRTGNASSGHARRPTAGETQKPRWGRRSAGSDRDCPGTRVHGRTRPGGSGARAPGWESVMTRRLLGPIGGPIAFFLVAALVFAGLGWVTYTALQVEQAQREAAARAGTRQQPPRRALATRWPHAPARSAVEDTRPYYPLRPARSRRDAAPRRQPAGLDEAALPARSGRGLVFAAGSRRPKRPSGSARRGRTCLLATSPATGAPSSTTSRHATRPATRSTLSRPPAAHLPDDALALAPPTRRRGVRRSAARNHFESRRPMPPTEPVPMPPQPMLGCRFQRQQPPAPTSSNSDSILSLRLGTVSCATIN